MLLSLLFKSWSVVLSHQSVQYCLALPFLFALCVGVDDRTRANEVGLQLSHQHSTAAPFFFTQRLPPEV